MGEIVGYVSRTGGMGFVELSGLPPVRANPSQLNSFSASTVSGGPIEGSFGSLGAAQIAVEGTFGRRLQWTVERNRGGEVYVGRSPFIFPGDYPNAGGLWLRGSRGVRQVARATDPGARFAASWASLDGTAGRQAIQLTDADQPTYVADAVNGQPALTFDVSTTEFMTTNLVGQLGAPFSGFHVIRYRDAGRDQIVVQSDGGYELRVTAGGVLELEVGAGTINGGAVTDGEILIVSSIMSSTATSLSRNGVVVGSTANVAAAGDWTISDPADAWGGDIAELYFYPNELTQTQADELLTNYFNRLYRVY